MIWFFYISQIECIATGQSEKIAVEANIAHKPVKGNVLENFYFLLLVLL